ncbi:MAG: hypothetical protein OEU26_24040 [Candidatus Tectomicrobia bacterium]|nr:hypothetical protein [Candidatus Tectomicrobia bacterium]
MLHRSGHGAGEFGLFVHQRIIAGGHRGIDAGLQVAQLAQCANHPLADLVDDLGNVSIAGGIDLDKLRLETLSGTIAVDPLYENQVVMFVYGAGSETNKLASYRINQDTGELTPMEVYDVGKRPMWVLITNIGG